MNITQRVKKLERLSSASEGTDIFIYLGDFEDDGYVFESHNGGTRRITIEEFKTIEAASRKIGDKWITVGSEID